MNRQIVRAMWGAIYHGIWPWTMRYDRKKEDLVVTNKTRIIIETDTVTIVHQPEGVAEAALRDRLAKQNIVTPENEVRDLEETP